MPGRKKENREAKKTQRLIKNNTKRWKTIGVKRRQRGKRDKEVGKLKSLVPL